MKEGYKLCPYCANEIKEGAAKCQYCKTFLKTENEEENTVKNLNESADSGKSKRKRNLIIRIAVLILLVILGIFGYKQLINYYVDDVINRANNVKDYSGAYSILSELDMVDSEEGQEALKIFEANEKIREYNAEYKTKGTEIGQLYIYNLKDYKNLNIINDCLNNWELYKKNTNEYYNKVKNVIDGVDSLKNDSEFSSILSQLKDITKRADLNIDFLSYMKSIQNEFYVSEDGQAIFYDDAKYNEWYQHLVDFSEQSEIYNKKYAKYLQ